MPITLKRIAVALAVIAMLAAACGTAGEVDTGSTATSADAPSDVEADSTAAASETADDEPEATTAAAEAADESSDEAMAEPEAEIPNCGTENVTLKSTFESGFDLPFKLAEEFSRQFPHVEFDIDEAAFAYLINETPRLLSGDNPPDLIRLPTMVSFAKDGLLLNLDPYAESFGWVGWPVPQLDQAGVGDDGIRGAGTLYAAALNYSLTGVFYNKALAAQIGMTEPPQTLAEFEALLAEAKAQGLVPIMQWNALPSSGGLGFPLQHLMASLGPVEPLNDWVFQKPGATIVTPSNLKAAEHLENWVKSEYFPSDLNAIQYFDSNSRFAQGEGVFTFNGDWQNAGYDADMGANVGFFLFPPAESDPPATTSTNSLSVRHRSDRTECRLCGVLLPLDRHE